MPVFPAVPASAPKHLHQVKEPYYIKDTFDYSPPGAQPLLFGILYAIERGTVLDAAAGVHELCFGEDGASSECGEMREVQQGRGANGTDEPVGGAEHGKDSIEISLRNELWSGMVDLIQDRRFMSNVIGYVNIASKYRLYSVSIIQLIPTMITAVALLWR